MAAPESSLRLVKALPVSIRSVGLDEAYIESFIKGDPSVLGLGDDVAVIASQRRQERGRLDLLLQDGAQERRYEVELMLGSLDETHLVRAIEYWDIERRTYPAYEHSAVIVAENLTARFLNVITLFSGSIPIIAIQMNAVSVEDKTALSFTRIIDSRTLRKDDLLGSTAVASDRNAWLSWAGIEIIRLVDECLTFINEEASRPRNLKYNSDFIGLTESGITNNIVTFSPNKSSLWINIRNIKEYSDQWIKRVRESGLDYRDETQDGKLRLKVTPQSFVINRNLIQELLQQSVRRDETAQS